MSLVGPELDDLTFDQLVALALDRINTRGGTWKAPAPGDPGLVLIDAFAYITEQLLYRFNRLPEKVYIELLNLIGARLFAPSAARARLMFTLAVGAPTRIVIPCGTRVSATRGADGASDIIFAVVEDTLIEEGQISAESLALNADHVTDELVGIGTGDGGQRFTVARAPIIATSGTKFDVDVAVEFPAVIGGAPAGRGDARVIDGVTYEIWHEVDSFADIEIDAPVFRCDHFAGTIAFAPRLREKKVGVDELAPESAPTSRVPASGSRIRVSYATGGGFGGNVVAGTLTSLKDQIGAAITVTNVDAASGGCDAETLENALARGPREFQTLQRAVTARDFELVAMNDPAVARARAYPKHELWKYAKPGTVEVLLVPNYLRPLDRTGGRVTAQALATFQRGSEALTGLQRKLDEMRPLGVICDVGWVRYKTVVVQANVYVSRGENAAAVQGRLIAALHSMINPLSTPGSRGWRFGRPLLVSDVTNLLLAERGVAYYENVRLIVDDAPSSDVRSISVDPTESGRWYANGGGSLYRSRDDASSWERVAAFSGERVVKVALAEDAPGRIAVVTVSPVDGEPTASIVRVSNNAGESWGEPASLSDIIVADITWVRRDDGLALLLATNKGLYELPDVPNAHAVPGQAFEGDDKFGFFSITSTRVNGRVCVAVAAQAQYGIWMSNQAGIRGTFERWPDPPNANSVVVLRVQRDGARAFLWAGFDASGNDEGAGASRIEIGGLPRAQSTQAWTSYAGWKGQDLRELAFGQQAVFAASGTRGVVVLRLDNPVPQWRPLELETGLPERTSQNPTGPQKNYDLVTTVGATETAVLAGGARGVFRSLDGGLKYGSASAGEFDNRVPLPPMWLFCSGTHRINVGEDKRDLT